MTPGKPNYFHLVPHLLSFETALQCKSEDSTGKILDLDHQGGFAVCQIGSTGGWRLLHALIAALTMHHHSYDFCVLNLHCYRYRRALKDEIVDRVSTAGFLALFKLAAENCTVDCDITAQAMDSCWGTSDLDHTHSFWYNLQATRWPCCLVYSPSHVL